MRVTALERGPRKSCDLCCPYWAPSTRFDLRRRFPADSSTRIVASLRYNYWNSPLLPCVCVCVCARACVLGMLPYFCALCPPEVCGPCARLPGRVCGLRAKRRFSPLQEPALVLAKPSDERASETEGRLSHGGGGGLVVWHMRWGFLG